MKTPVHCTQCDVPIPKLCPHIPAADMLAKILDATTTSEQIMATMEVMEYIQDLQKAMLNPPPPLVVRPHRPMWATKTDDILEELKKSEIVSTAQMPTVFNILSKHLGRKP